MWRSPADHCNVINEEMQRCFELGWKGAKNDWVLDIFAGRLWCGVREILESRLMPSIWIAAPGRLKLVLVKVRETGVRSFPFMHS